MTPCISDRRAKAWRLQDFKSSFDSSHRIQVGSDVLPASAENGVGMMGSESWMSSTE